MSDNDPLDREGEADARAVSRSAADPHGQRHEAQDIDAKTQDANRKLHGIDWQGIEHAYVHSGWSVQRIADAYGPCRATIRKRAKVGGWIRLVEPQRHRSGRPPRPPGVPEANKPPVTIRRRRTFIKRLFKVLDSRLIAMEARMADTNANSPALGAVEIEREARAVSTIAGCYAKIVELEEAARKAGKASEMSTTRSAEDADRLRRDLAERLERLIPPRTE